MLIFCGHLLIVWKNGDIVRLWFRGHRTQPLQLYGAIRGAWAPTQVDLYCFFLTYGTDRAQLASGPTVRDAIRNGPLRLVDTRIATMAYYFVMSPPSTQEGLSLALEENATWGDIVFANFTERDLSHKVWTQIHTLTDEAAGHHTPLYVAKLDDDSFVRFDRLLSRIAQFKAAGGEGGGGGGFASKFYWGVRGPWTFFAPSNYIMSGDVATWVGSFLPHGITFVVGDPAPRNDEDVVIGEMASGFVNRIMLDDRISWQQGTTKTDCRLNGTDFLVMHNTGSECMQLAAKQIAAELADATKTRGLKDLIGEPPCCWQTVGLHVQRRLDLFDAIRLNESRQLSFRADLLGEADGELSCVAAL